MIAIQYNNNVYMYKLMLEYEINNNIYPHCVTLVRMLALQMCYWQTSNYTKKKK